ncbi:Uncharacterised protein [uncultured archaeon]|nr:Uncharacterised protein [uncultured archaeon]
MKKKVSLIIILIISIAGILFSGYLSYGELFKKSCPLGACTAPPIFGVPVCVYGFVMYLLVFIISILGIISKK